MLPLETASLFGLPQIDEALVFCLSTGSAARIVWPSPHVSYVYSVCCYDTAHLVAESQGTSISTRYIHNQPHVNIMSVNKSLHNLSSVTFMIVR